ncbi:zinc finger CW-type PWWP domain protein 1 isoform X1 [Cervus elaphus]|uniref:zinc finger CW-type PWWP domain protein 1 isoform X1 n=2 Tax=Cervus elaphus TaxID=9860 RepID=UPI001CC29F1B|nr:zinc finger CW-type PWWP domain protein 1 isoform X1 [Cervus elaphus]XP_043771097.1 zinc finger CW-type PWWP domain protein 1 isoform X1 [Cervus elaphus]XP_043771098.1 zinc finger CW-type PWWP domain protein 1 isoform X1 [Cervus elaphus]XP_043771099.1 zinc finger CW-type PWWP domain protein 1 isoform X1 [Cervus elaphus]
MMPTLESKEKCGKGQKNTFAPPAQKLHSLMPYNLNSSKEEILEISSPQAEVRPSLLKAGLEKKKEKTTTENGPVSGQEIKGKAQDSKKAKKEKEKSTLTSAEFEEIVQIVLRKSFQECLETSCTQPTRCTQLDKEPRIASSNTSDNNNADGDRVVVPPILEISASQEDGIIPEIKISKPGQPDSASSEKKFSKFSLSRRKKEAQDEKMETDQSGHEHRQDNQQKETIQDHSQNRDQQKGEGSGFGQCLVWVQCSSPNCEKWRRLHGNIDPSILPDNWSCDQNTDLQYNRCDIPEETWTGHESDVAYASYIPGSIIWAKQYGYPWWPGMVEPDPDLGEYFLFASHLDSLPSKYHVTFFGETVSRAWIPVSMLKNFQELSLELSGLRKCKNKDCIQKLGLAVMMAQKAEQISIQERVNLFGFWSRYSGPDDSGEEKDLLLSGASSLDSCLEKEKKEPELEEDEDEEQDKTDPTLPNPKSAKIQTKKPKARGLGVGSDAGGADGQDGTLKRRTTKRPLLNEPAPPPVPIIGRKKGHGNSGPEQPDPKKKFKAPQSKAPVSSLSEEKEARLVPEVLTPPAARGACLGGEEGPEPQDAGSVPSDDGASSDLDLDQLMEDVGEELEPREEPQHRVDTGELTVAFCEE